VIDSLAEDADLLIGTDQLGKSIKMDLGFDESLVVSVKDKKGRVIDYVIRDKLGIIPYDSTSRNNFVAADSKADNVYGMTENNNYIETQSKVEENSIETSSKREESTSSTSFYDESEYANSFTPVFHLTGREDSRELELIMRRGELMSQLQGILEIRFSAEETLSYDSRKSRKKYRELKIDIAQQLEEREKLITENILQVDADYHQYQLRLKVQFQKDRLKLKSTNKAVFEQFFTGGISLQKISKKERAKQKQALLDEISKNAKEEGMNYFASEYNHFHDSIPSESEITNFMTAEAHKIADQPLEREWSEPIWDVEEAKNFVPHTLHVNEQMKVDNLLQNKKDTLVGKDDKVKMGKATLPNGEKLEFDLEITHEGQQKLTSKSTSKPYKMKKPLVDLLRQTLSDMELQEVGSMSSPDWSAKFASPAFFVVNKEKARFCVNYTELNEMTVNDVYPIPDIDSILEDFHGKRYFSIIDLKSGYHQFPLSENAKRYAACITPEGIFKYDCMTFGFKNAPAFFQRFMNNTFSDYMGKFVRIYIDDIVIFSNSFEEHLKHVESVLERLAKCNIKANREKCHFFLKEMRVLGKIISEDGIKPDPELIRAMAEFPIPNSKTKIREVE
jgi:hypothetical protein